MEKPVGHQSDPGEQQHERRQIRRKLIKVRKTVLAEIFQAQDEERKKCYIYINDVSEGGLRITCDVFIPENTVIKLLITLEKQVALEGKVVWAKEFGSGNYTMGLELSQDRDDYRENVDFLFDWASPMEVKRSFRPRATKHFELHTEEQVTKFYAHLLIISPGGMELIFRKPLPEDRDFSLTFALFEKGKPITTRARVIFQRELVPLCPLDYLEKTYKIWIEFFDTEAVFAHLEEAVSRGALEEHLPL
ncbi:MAG: PilZ domain-containing protein [Candidatus Eremiobacteraeota bacterium]|nr:PilZ domain-containing protein [Candidatus Eremiobacteraeota bacterium]